MPLEHSADDALYLVAINQEEQYSIWPAAKVLPLGWKTVGEPRVKSECLSHIEEAWVDMRPLSLRMQMDASKPGGTDPQYPNKYDTN